MTEPYTVSAPNDPTLKEAKENLLILLNDARKCAEYQYTDNIGRPRSLGIPAMSTALSVLVALGEVLYDQDEKSKRKRIPSDEDSIRRICPKLLSCSDVKKWYYSPALTEEVICDDLWKIRNGIVHAAALPDNIELNANNNWNSNPNGYRRIALLQFIDATEATLNSLDENLPFTPVAKQKGRSLFIITPFDPGAFCSQDDLMRAAGTAGEPRNREIP